MLILPFVRFHYLSAGRSRTSNVVTEDRGPSGLIKGRGDQRRLPFRFFLAAYIIFRRLLTGLKNIFKTSYITNLHVDGPVTRVGWGLGLIIGSLRYFITCMRKKETLLLFPPVYSLKVMVAYENRKLSEKLKEKENWSGRTAKCFYSLLS